MENCFRFLINIDQCINMSSFDIFFYKLESQHKFHVSNVQLFGDSADGSLREAVNDIRLYLDKYPYHVGDYQITVTMRSEYKEQVDKFEDTMLYRLIHMNHELRKARIFINSRELQDKALNLVMLYDADFSVDLPKLTTYMASERFIRDCHLLLRHFGVDENTSVRKDYEKALATYKDLENSSDAIVSLMERFVTSHCNDILPFMEGEEDSDYTEDVEPCSYCMEFIPFLKDQFANFQVFEEHIDRNSRRQNILSLLRVTEFINMNVDDSISLDGHENVSTLSQRCAHNWNKVWNDVGLEKRYADMLCSYQQHLQDAALELERPGGFNASATDLPKETLPGDEDITCTDNVFSSDDPNKQGGDLRAILDKFLSNKFSIKSVVAGWNGVYEHIKQALAKMEHELKTYAENLSHQYAAILEERKHDSIVWKNNFFVANSDTEKDISRLAYEKDLRLQKLKSPHMNPSLSFQDQLNMESSLEQANLTIRFYLGCINKITAFNFVLLLVVSALLSFVHYTLLMPYALQGMNSLIYYLIYLGIILLLMFFCWLMPYWHYKKKMKVCIASLKEDMDKYIAGYFKKAKHFKEYINLLNQLDYITRYHRLLTQAFNSSHKLSQGFLWHRIQVKNHLSKLQFFQGLIDIGEKSDKDDIPLTTPAVHGDQVSDVIDSPIYWPQA